MRDVFSVFDLEREIRRYAPANQIILQPIDRWVYRIATCLWDDLRKLQRKLRDYPNVIALRIVN